ncbi:MAG: hypothetical protein J5950_05035 [Clostridia bacterium]|nr:hypothetical protein [Clostridia bacterium]
MKHNANAENDELLKKYMKHLPKSMLDEARNASPAPKSASAKREKWIGLRATAALAAVVICVIAGIVIAITVMRSKDRSNDITEIGATETAGMITPAPSDAPADTKTPDVTAATEPTVNEESTPEFTVTATSVPAQTATPDGATTNKTETATSAPDKTPAGTSASTPAGTSASTPAAATPTPPNAPATPTKAPTSGTTSNSTSYPTSYPTATPASTEIVTDTQKEEVFGIPVYSSNCDQDIVRRITAIRSGFTDVYEYAAGADNRENMVFFARYYDNSGKWDKQVFKYDEKGRRVFENYYSSDGSSQLNQTRYDDAGNPLWNSNMVVNADGSWMVLEVEQNVCSELRRSDGTMSYYDTYRDTGTVKVMRQYIPENEGDINYCFAKYYDKSGNLTSLKLVVFRDGGWFDTDYVEQPATPTAAPATPVPTPQLSFEIPEGTKKYTIEIDRGMASEYPELIPAEFSYGENGFIFETVNVVLPGTYYARSVEGGDLKTYRIGSNVYFRFEYIGSVQTEKRNESEIIMMNVDRVRVRLEFTSASDRETMKSIVSALKADLSSDYTRSVQYGDITALLSGEKLVFAVNNYDGLRGDMLCFSRKHVRSLWIEKTGNVSLLSSVSLADSTNAAATPDMYRFTYNNGSIATVSLTRGNNLAYRREYIDGELIRSYEQINLSSYVEIFYDRDNSRTVTTTVKGDNKTVVEEYIGRADLLATITKKTVASGNNTEYTETVCYFKAAGSAGTWTGSEKKRIESKDGQTWSETIRMYDINGRTLSIISDNSGGTRNESVNVWNDNGINTESRSVMTQDGEKISENITRRTDSGTLIYYYKAWFFEGVLSEKIYNGNGVLLIDREYDRVTGTNEWYGFARYYDETGKLIEEKTIVFENGEWIEI